MTLTKVQNPGLPLFPAYVRFLLPDGRLVVVRGGQTFVLEPSPTGDYMAGTWVETDLIPYTYTYAHSLIQNDGRFVVFPGEYGSGNQIFFRGKSYASVYDPRANTWSAVEQTYLPTDPEHGDLADQRFDRGIEGHLGSAMADDGRYYNSTTIAPARVTDPNQRAPWSRAEAGANQVLRNYETALTMLPDGSALELRFPGGNEFTGLRFVRYSPGYEADQIAAGSRSGGASATVTTAASTAIQNAVNASQVDMTWRVGTTANKLTSTGPAIKYEIGAQFWMPKISKVVLICGWGGIWTMNADGTGLTLAARTPHVRGYTAADTPRVCEPIVVGTIRSFDAINSKSPAVIGGEGTLTVDIGAWFASQPNIIADENARPASGTAVELGTATRSFYIELANKTQWARFTYTSMTRNGNLLTFNGIARVDGVASQTAVATGDRVTLGRPSLEPMDAPAGFLPNGDVVFLAGTSQRYREGFFNQGAVALKWDGVSTTATYLTTPERVCNFEYFDTAVPEFAYSIFMVPDGHLVIQGATDAYWYTPTPEEATPLPESVPVITHAPSIAPAGSRITVTGTTLNGTHEGGTFGDDYSDRTNFPVVRLRRFRDGLVRWCHSRDWSYRGILPGRTSTFVVELPEDLTPDEYEMTVITHGVPSDPVGLIVTPAAGDPIFIPHS